MTDGLTPDEWRAVALSLRVSLVAVAVSLPLGVFVAYAHRQEILAAASRFGLPVPAPRIG